MNKSKSGKAKLKAKPSTSSVSKPLAARVPTASAVKYTSGAKVDQTIDHREFAFTVSGNSATFALLGSSGSFPGYDINPGNNLLFPWLSIISRAYEKYRFELLEFEIVPRNPTTVAGAVYAAVDYDWDDSVATSAPELMSNRGAISADVWSPSVLRVDCTKMNEDIPYRYVEAAARAINSQRMVYGGFMMIGIAGTAVSVAFDVFVRYRIKLSLPALHAINSVALFAYPGTQTLVAGTDTTPRGLPALDGITQVVSGSNGVPSWGGINARIGYAISNVAKGILALRMHLATVGATPASFANDSKFDAQLFDAKGNFLATAVPQSLMQGAIYQGPANPAEWAVNDKTGHVSWSLPIAAIRQAYPLAAYIWPYVASTAGRVLSTASLIDGKYLEL